MDASHANNATHIQHGGSDNTDNAFGVDFLGAIQEFAHDPDPNDIQYFHPDLFDSQEFSNGLRTQAQPQQSQPQQHTYPNPTMNQSASGRSQSPALTAFSQSQQYSQHQSYPQSLYGQGNPYTQQPYDPRMFQQRPSHSPAPLDRYGYSNHYAGQNHQNLINIQPRPSPSPAPHYPPGQQNYSVSPYTTFDSRGPPLPQRQDPEMMQFAGFRSPSQTQSHAFVNPTMLDGHGPTGHYPLLQQPQQPQRSQSDLYYPKPDTSIGRSFPAQTLNQDLPPAMQPNQMQVTHPNNFSQANMIPPAGAIQQHLPATTQHTNTAVQPKKSRGRPRKDGKLTKSNGGTASSESESDLEIEDEAPEPPPALIAVNAPTDPRAKAVFDALLAVWSPRNKAAPTAKIKSGIFQFGEIIRGVRDQWKTRNDNLKKAEADKSATAADAPILRQETAQYRQTMETLVNRTAIFGHPAILKSLGEIPYTLSALYSFMLDRVSAADYDSSLLLAIFKLAEKFTTVDEEKLESSKWTKLLQRVTKKGSAEAKTLAEQILANAKKQSAAKAEAAKSETKGSTDLAAGTKRAREGESNGPVPKKVVRPSSKPLAVQNAEKAEKRRIELLAEAAKKGKPASAVTGGGTLITPAAAKPKPPIKPTTTTSFSAIMSASKKPGTTNAERAAAAKLKDGAVPIVQQVKREPVTRDSPPASTSVAAAAANKGSSSFLSNFFSSMDKKEEVKPVQEEEDTSETPEEKSKRLRKESRRRLRVSWKNDTELVETRLFNHDPDEETSQGDSAKKDAGDIGKEGEMLKRHQGMADLDDDDDDDEGEDDPDFDPDCYTAPTEVDFSEIASDDNDPAINGVKHGGSLSADSKAKEAQSRFEETVLMVFYTESDRPDSPKEPPEEADDDFSPSDDFGEPEDKVRNREKEIYARRQPQASRLDDASDFGSTLQSLTNNGMQQYFSQPSQATTDDLHAQSQQAAATIPAAGFDWQSILAAVSNKTPYNNSNQPTPTPSIDLQTILGNLQPHLQAAQPTPMPNYGVGNFSNDDYGNSNASAKSKAKKGKNPVPLDANGLPLNYKTRVCEFWEKGMCSKGDNCTFKHSR